MVTYCAPLLGARAAFLSGQNLGKVVLGKVLSATELGYYSFAFQTVERFVELVHTLPSALLPSLTHLVTREERERLRYVFDQAFRLIQVVACGLAMLLFVFAPELTLWVGSPLFSPAIPLLRVLALVPIARTAQQPLTMLFQAMRRPGLVLLLALLKFAIEIGSYVLLVPSYGPMGAAWANVSGAVLSYVVALALLAVAMPEGAGERLSAVLRSVALLAPGVLLALAADRFASPHASTALRVAIVAPWLLGTFALGLITRYDLEKLSSLPLGAPWMRSIRDSLVRAADRLARAFEPRRAA
jgi:O-antigen/teichoic acid export membrane protein